MFWKKYEALCTQSGKSPNAVAKELNIASGTVTEWKKGNRTPQNSTLLKIANYFGVTVEYLKGEEKEKNPDKSSEFIELYSKLTDEQKKLVVAQMKGIISNQ